MSLEIDAVEVRYRDRIAVEALSTEIAAGRVVALVGPNGAGKSSLLKALACLVPAGGDVRWNGRSLTRLDARERARLVAYLPQSPAAHWPMPVRDVVALGRLPHRGFGARPGPDDAAAVDGAMRSTDVAGLAGRSVDELSGGEAARVQLARALAVEAPILLVDEPVASLDPYHQLKIMAQLADCAARGALVIAVLHDLALAARFAGLMLLLHDGRLVASGPPRDVLNEESLEKYYRVQPFIAQHDGQPLIVPWARVD